MSPRTPSWDGRGIGFVGAGGHARNMSGSGVGGREAVWEGEGDGDGESVADTDATDMTDTTDVTSQGSLTSVD